MDAQSLSRNAATLSEITEDRRHRALHMAFEVCRHNGAVDHDRLIESAKAIERYLAGDEDRQAQSDGETATPRPRLRDADAVVEHPDGTVIVRVNDHWFPITLVTLK